MVIFYADKVTESMQKTIDETNRKREKQIRYNVENIITPAPIIKSAGEIMGQTTVIDSKMKAPKAYVEKEQIDAAADPLVNYLNKDQLKKLVDEARRAMEKAAKELDFYEAARLRDEMLAYKAKLEQFGKLS
jgi:excinuclease ABC subunit B